MKGEIKMKRLKKIELDDLNELTAMLNDFWRTQLYEPTKEDILEDIRRLLNPKFVSFLIMDEDEIAGFIYVNEKYGYINNIEYLFIKKEHRGKGLASFTIEETKKVLFELGNKSVQIEVSPNNNTALKLYHKLGFDNIDTFTLSTKIVGKTEKVKIMGLEFKINPETEFIKEKN